MSLKKHGYGYGFGKTILFGEHFVVYGLPAIVSALGFKTTAKIEEIKGEDTSSEKKFELVDLRPKVPTYNPDTLRNYRLAIVENVLKISEVTNKVKITLAGDLTVCSGGIGASAAFASSLARAISDYYDLNWDDQKINEVAYEGEKGAHGTPSGIDNTAAVFGGAFCFKKKLDIWEKEPVRGELVEPFERPLYFVDPISFKHPVEIVLVDSGIVGGTKNVVGAVKELFEQDPEKIKIIFDEYKKLFEQAKKALADFDLKALGNLMNKNQELLSALTVSCPKLDEIIDIAKKAGAFGAKLTGTGRGGLVLALTPGKVLQENVASALEQSGFFTLKTTIG